MSELFDPGLQPERTELAWRRTSLALAVGSLIAMRLLPSFFGNAVWAVVGACGLIAAAVLWVWAHRRGKVIVARLREAGDRAKLPGAAALAATAALTGTVGTVALAAVLFSTAR